MGSDYSMNPPTVRSSVGSTGLPDPDRIRPVYPKIYTARVTIYTDPAANADFEAKITGTVPTICRMLAAIGDAFEEEAER